jgi:Flp pilus assembly protein TadD
MAEPHALLGSLLAQKGKLPEAAAEYRQAIQLRPGFARARLDLASVLAAQGEMQQAIEQLREAARGSDPQVARLAAAALQRLEKR